jgi:alkylation response protein AidB-like acyl-CoA dehydrogenase
MTMQPVYPLPETNATVDWIAVARQLAAEFKAGAIERDRSNARPVEALAKIRESELVNLFFPKKYGGEGGSIRECAWAVLELSKADASIGALLGFHYYNSAIPMFLDFTGDNAAFIRRSTQHRWYWGNITQYVNKNFIAVPQGDGSFIVNGTKKWNTGAPLSDVTTVLAVHGNGKQFIYGVIPTAREGVRFHGDWDQLGLRGADSSTVTFTDVRIGPDEIMHWGHDGVQVSATPFWTTFGAVYYSAVFLGCTLAALEAARDLARDQPRQVVSAGAKRTADDPLIQKEFGELWIKAEAALAYFERVIAELQVGWDNRAQLSEEGRGVLAVKTLGLRTFTSAVALEVTPRVYDFAGGRVTGSSYGLDRFWRDARMLTMHDPMLYSTRIVGDYGLNDKVVMFPSRFTS